MATGDEKKSGWKVRPVGYAEWLYIDSLDELEQMIDRNDGEEFELVHVLMTDAEVEALGEFGGW